MKRRIFFAFSASVVVLLFMVLFTACGMKGTDGSAFIAYSWLYDPFSYSSNDPGIPGSGAVNGHYYYTQPGTYSFAYQAWDGSVWSGHYTITINEGKPGGLFSKGTDGVDIYYELTCYSIGPSFYAWPYAYSAANPRGAADHSYSDRLNQEQQKHQAAE